MEIYNLFTEKVKDFADGKTGLKDMKELMPALDNALQGLGRDDIEKFLLKLSSEISKIEDPKNKDFPAFIMDFSMWVYGWKKQVSPTKKDMQIMDTDNCDL